MDDDRVQLWKPKAQATTAAAAKAIRTLSKRGEPITFRAVQREAGSRTRTSHNRPACVVASNTCSRKPKEADFSRPQWGTVQVATDTL